MTPEEALAQIDNVVADWTVSDDAMRWRPEPAEDDELPYRSGYQIEGTPFGGSALDDLIASRMREAQRMANIEASWEGWTERNMARGWGRGGRLEDDQPQRSSWSSDWGRLTPESEHDPAGRYERETQRRRLEVRWDADYPPAIPTDPERVRVYVSTDARPLDPASPDWVELRYADSRWRLEDLRRTPGMQGLRPQFVALGEAYRMANPEMPGLRDLAQRIGVGLADWQVRLASAWTRVAEASRAMEALTETPMDRDRPGHPLHEANGLMAQRSPYGHDRRSGPAPVRPATAPPRPSHRRHTRRAS